MSTHRVQNLMVSSDNAIVAGGLAVNTTNIATQGKLAFVGDNGLTLAAGATISDSETLQIYSYITANASLKRTMSIPGRRITKFDAVTYSPATRKVQAIGYNRKTATGSIPVSVDSEYVFAVHVKSDKQTYSQRNLNITLTIQSSLTATQSTIADQVVAAINGPTGSNNYLNQMVKAVKVGDGTGAYGLSGASNYGVEVWGKLLTQAVGSYAIETPDFEIELNDLSGWGSNFRPTTISNAYQGNGSYQQMYNLENFLLGEEGQMNRTLWPTPVQNFTVSSTANLSSQIAGSGNVGVTNGSDKITFVTTNASLVPGDLVDLDGGNYEIKYLIGTTGAILTEVFAGSTTATSVLKKRVFYDAIVIEFTNPKLFDGAGVTGDNKQSVIIAVPGCTAGAAYNVASTAGASILSILNPYMNSLGFGSITL